MSEHDVEVALNEEAALARALMHNLASHERKPKETAEMAADFAFAWSHEVQRRGWAREVRPVKGREWSGAAHIALGGFLMAVGVIIGLALRAFVVALQ